MKIIFSILGINSPLPHLGKLGVDDFLTFGIRADISLRSHERSLALKFLRPPSGKNSLLATPDTHCCAHKINFLAGNKSYHNRRQIANPEEKATLAGGCFWCTQAIFKRLKGVKSVTAGYAGGTITQPTYQQVSQGKTGHAEAIQIEFNPRVIPFDKLLKIFWATHDPTTPNSQGPDVGPQYRSAIFYHSREQKIISEKIKAKIEKSGVYQNKIVTQIMPFENFYPAENYHQNYYEINKNSNPYCSIIIDPKIQKLMHQFGSNVKEEYRYGQNQD